jgi:two-component system chemotaxis response regulator CheY
MARPTNALIVDDEPHVRTFVRLLLKEIGITQTWEAGDGAQGLAMVAEHEPELIVLDVNLPVMSGLELLARLHADRPDIPVVMLSSESAMKTVLEAVRLGAIGYVLKHSAKDEALKTLREALDQLDEAAEEAD